MFIPRTTGVPGRRPSLHPLLRDTKWPFMTRLTWTPSPQNSDPLLVATWWWATATPPTAW